MTAIDSLDVTWRAMLMFAVVFSLVCVALRLCFQRTESRACLILSAFLIVFALNQTPQIIGYAGFYQAFPWLTFAPFKNDIWLGPLLLWHVLTLTKQDPKRWEIALFLPAVLQSLYYLVVFLIFPDYRDKWAYNDAIHMPYVVPFEFLVTVVVSLYCLARSFTSIRRYQNSLPQITSDNESFDIRWLGQFVLGFATLYCIWIASELYHQVIATLSYPDYFPIYVLLTLIVLVMGLNALANIQYPYPKMVTNSCSQQIAGQQTPSTLQLLAEQITHLMENEHWFLRPKVTLTDLAQRLASNESYVSRAINEYFAKNFSTLVNGYRIDYVKHCLITEETPNITDIQFRAGFNSKASFYRCFKQMEGKTPAEYIRTMQRTRNVSAEQTSIEMG